MKQRYFLLLAALALATPAAVAQTTPAVIPAPAPPAVPDPLWHKSIKTGLGLNEALLSTNWRGGGVNTIGFNALFNAKANRKSGVHSFDNEADFLFAFSQTKGLGYRKGQDRLFLDTKYGRALTDRWDMFLSLNLLSQFAPGYKYDTDAAGNDRAQLTSDSFAPAFITAAYGFEYHPTTYFHVRLAPFAPRLTVVNRVERFVAALGDTPYGVRAGHSTRFEVLAAQVLAEYDRNISPNVNFKARYVLFANYEHLNLQEIDHRLDVGLTAKVGKYVNVALNGIALYDYDQDHSIQFSQGLTIGVAYAFQNFVDAKK
ncbi:DUF3078 domain-containing protein [Hymenobacter negativus]|uniref:DUF3078 domain-containing protein n=1 Tax=Hymenobacter negativus TaxID=2795026 RepID=A0ABS0Q244_9BACT|nr:MULTISPECIES: DUF3078 domain-containing protein [Bacteria]MBH8556660.1 DUF3078 domain-containing protein [Hymenobacter negativus]MBH8571183.1 DUF3078 domain-containing protein [Hymenobacter negativus]MBR7210920.1 DUF3078 domain-containing protein [Microvirga sp. STS02]